jgi:RNA polymerase sigma-70 factor (ECF subfamily)
MAEDDNKLVAQTLAGSERAFEALVDRYEDVVFNVAYHMTRNFDESEDITQAVFVKVFEKMESFNPKFKFFSWIYRIAVNETLNRIARQSRTSKLDERLASGNKTPDESYSQTELSEKVRDAVMQIDPKYRILIVLKHFRDRSYREIADIVSLPEKTVKSRLFTARQLLKDILVSRGIVGHD